MTTTGEHHHWVEPVHIPNRIFLVLSWVIILATFLFAAKEYSNLPSQIPTHFGFNGLPDDWHTKSVWWVFFPVIIQFVLTTGLSILYRHPKYANIPGTMFITLLRPKDRDLLFWLVRHMLVITMVLMNALFAYITIVTVTSSYGDSSGLNPWMLFGIIALLLLVTMAYSAAAVRLSHRIIKRYETEKDTQKPS